MAENEAAAPDPVEVTGLLDIDGIDLAVLAELPDSVFHSALRRILADRAGQPDRFAAFQNSL
ncbi:FxSxx-COOH cyclophane-containing RiPP peptide [Actinokineospora sp. NBRC 105648]|uniref:FxSxx-COOH cyclophane-containing RiPP peptide n=1 Tax=Actinokineospora sp. NBRC 105648 TaxID=3032206 RepID=UPI0024A0EA56|nr:FxSxx-COOH cyclophane-containing RiPP peptide [Actinokineospora sp. NBRC 105648]GLZ41969.1 hypothetical protein Acsp05_55930 [Actinokineospora sp. NBRC 105648]